LPYFTMELVDGPSLDQRLARQPQPPRDAATLVETVARAVHSAHCRGIVHRDIKPANVLLAADGTPKVTDFGLAKRLDSAERLTRPGVVVGTPSYMAPEQVQDHAADIGPWTDTYALGVLLYEMLTGRVPFVGLSALDTASQVVRED